MACGLWPDDADADRFANRAAAASAVPWALWTGRIQEGIVTSGHWLLATGYGPFPAMSREP